MIGVTTIGGNNMDDIELSNAVIAVNAGLLGESFRGRNEIRVFRYLDPKANAYPMTWGACEARWRDNPEHRIGFLYEILWMLVHGLGFYPDAINEALQVIPEYRASNPRS
jgi:hypothetical protein